MGKFLTTETVAERLNVEVRTVHRLLKYKKLPGIKVGREWRVDEDDLTKWIKIHKGGTDDIIEQ